MIEKIRTSRGSRSDEFQPRDNRNIMKLLNYMIIIHLSYCLCQDQTDFQGKADGNNTGGVKLQEYKGDPRVHHSKCRWTLRLPGSRSGDVVPLSSDSTDSLVDQICQELDCGRVYSVDKTSAPPNATCFHDCLYKDQRLQNCSQRVSGGCTVINAALCGHQAVWLAAGPDRCAGRVELWRDGRQGTVCDDGWDLRDADVVCAQLGCGYAVGVTGQGGSFPPGTGPVLRDELNCSGREENLWSCQASQEEPDCGHKEDAGVTCSEMRDIRLTGGADRCAGKLEVHRNGSWGTVCDNCWSERLASMVCSMLGCGTTALNFSQFVPPLVHNQGPQWFYQCGPGHHNLWMCKEFVNKSHLCVDSKASGVICEGSLGFLPATKSNATPVTTSWTRVPAAPTAAAPPSEGLISASHLLLVFITVCLLLLVLLITNTVLCCHYRRRHAFLLQQSRTSPRPRRLNPYHETVDLVKVTAHSHQQQTTVPSDPRYLWTQRSSVDSSSVDTDYEQGDPSNDPSFPLSTFRNSQRYRNHTNPSPMPSGADGLCPEGSAPTHKDTGAFSAASGGPPDAQQARASVISVDSFDTSSTSSGEDYQNINKGAYINVTPDPGLDQSSAASGAPDPLRFFNNHQHHSAPATNQSSSDEDDGPLYSPVSPD
ncbi:T-cell differentiation antigen CD6 isoform X1 [Pleuronectes platessa]|uniref:T-cell differentiation antigen CD6 isoform X1 n=1 Tax=Pleuronectes platessa TaxID=8262 RepID=UPI00232A663F|nr:T-cell differentiation antigen CD6 isoform X1 [Pleuronectes platessa]